MKRVLILLLCVLVVGCGEDPRKEKEYNDFDFARSMQARRMEQFREGTYTAESAMRTIADTKAITDRNEYGGIGAHDRAKQDLQNIKDVKELVASEVAYFILHNKDVTYSLLVKKAMELTFLSERELEEIIEAQRRIHSFDKQR